MDPHHTAPSPTQIEPGDPRRVFLEQVRLIPDLALRAKALAAVHGERTLTTLLGGEPVASMRYPVEGFPPWREQRTEPPRGPVGLRLRARMSEDGLVNRTG